MVQAFDVPHTDRYQVINQHQIGEIIAEDTGLGYKRSEKLVLLTVVSRPRSQEQKINFYKILSERLQTVCEIPQNDLIISIVENNDADWSFGNGRAQFITGEL